MAYTRAWDETFPADTQLANLLGQDVRNTKADVRERVASFGAGTHANRPTPEAVFAGVVYFETDTGLMFRWNGAAWDNVTNTFFAPPTGVAGDWAVGGSLHVVADASVGGTLTSGTLNNGSVSGKPVVSDPAHSIKLTRDSAGVHGETLNVTIDATEVGNVVMGATGNRIFLVWNLGSGGLDVYIDNALQGTIPV